MPARDPARPADALASSTPGLPVGGLPVGGTPAPGSTVPVPRETRYGMAGSLRPAQQRALDRLDAVIAAALPPDDVRVQYHGASGSGKTLIARGVAEDLAATTMVFFAPRIDLLGQAYPDFQRATARPLAPVVVCSRPDLREARDFPADTLVTTSAPEVRRALAQQLPAGVLRVILATYHSADVVAEALRDRPPADLLVFDEAHRLAGTEGGRFSRVLRPTFLRGAVRLSLTATPLPGMEDGGAFGVVADRYTVGEGIADGVLADYRVLVLGVRDRDVASVLRAEPDRRSVAVAAALVDAYARGAMRRIFTFHRRRTDAEHFARLVARVADLRGVPMATLAAQSGLDTPTARVAMLERLHAEGGLIASPRIYLEGTDVPSVDTVVFVDPKSSFVDISQGIGRALRADPGDPAKRAQIVIPVAVADSAAADAVLADSEFRRVWDVLRVLALQDPRLEEALDQVRVRRARARLGRERAAPGAGPSSSTSAVGDAFLDAHLAAAGVFDAPADHRADAPPSAVDPRPAGPAHGAEPGAPPMGTPSAAAASAAEATVRNFADRVTLRAVTELGTRWSSDIAAVRAFAEDAGDVRAVDAADAAGMLVDGEPLAARAARLRRAYQQGVLTAGLRASADRIPGWREYAGVLSPVALVWADLVAWGERFGDARVPLTARAVDRDFPLGDHVEHLRAEHRAGTLPPDDARRLESLRGWVWDLSAPSLFHEAVPLLRAFVAEYGHARVPAPEMLPRPDRDRGVVAVVAELRAAHAAGRLHAGDVAALAREFGLSWAPVPFSPTDLRRWDAEHLALTRQQEAAARAARVRALQGVWGARA